MPSYPHAHQHARAPTSKNILTPTPIPTPSSLKAMVLFCLLGRKVCFPHCFSEGCGNPTVKESLVFSLVCPQTLPTPFTLSPLCGNTHSVGCRFLSQASPLHRRCKQKLCAFVSFVRLMFSCAITGLLLVFLSSLLSPAKPETGTIFSFIHPRTRLQQGFRCIS